MENTSAIKNKDNAEHYVWGNGCDGWHLVKTSNLSVIHEAVPPDKSEVKHHHTKSHQVFFVLKGTASIEINGETHVLRQNDSIEISPLVPHRLFNETDGTIEFLVISSPPSHGDKITE